MLHRRRTRLPARASAIAWKPSRERIIPTLPAVETLHCDVMAVTVRGSMLVVVLLLPLLAIPGVLTPEVLPLLALLLTASHGSSLVRGWIRLR